MNFMRVIFFVIAVISVMFCSVKAEPSPKWKGFKKIEKFGRNIRNGIIKAGPAVGVVGQAATIAKG